MVSDEDKISQLEISKLKVLPLETQKLLQQLVPAFSEVKEESSL
jgi:hypothetical protein